MKQIVHWLDSWQANVAWKLMALAALLLSLLIGIRQYEMTACQARYNEASNASQRARAQAAEVDRRALDDMLRSVADKPRESIAAVRAYNRARDVADLQRAENPIPAPPSATCK